MICILSIENFYEIKYRRYYDFFCVLRYLVCSCLKFRVLIVYSCVFLFVIEEVVLFKVIFFGVVYFEVVLEIR